MEKLSLRIEDIKSGFTRDRYPDMKKIKNKKLENIESRIKVTMKAKEKGGINDLSRPRL